MWCEGMFEKALLKENPFRITPGVAIWAGRHGIKRWLESFIKTQMIVTPSRCAVIYGVWGSGKSHAALYFSSKNVYLKPVSYTHLTLPTTERV